MSTLTHYRAPFGEMAERLAVPWTLLRPHTGRAIRVEDFIEDGRYILRAELPGVEPEHDIEVTVSGGVLTIKAERREEQAGRRRSEFSYGTFSRSVRLPAGADAEHIEAIYGHGILEVAVRLAGHADGKPARKVPVRQDQHIKPT